MPLLEMQKAIAESTRREGPAEGRIHAQRETLARLGRQKSGEPKKRILARIEALLDPEQLARILEQIFEANSWEEWLKEK